MSQHYLLVSGGPFGISDCDLCSDGQLYVLKNAFILRLVLSIV